MRPSALRWPVAITRLRAVPCVTSVPANACVGSVPFRSAVASPVGGRDCLTTGADSPVSSDSSTAR